MSFRSWIEIRTDLLRANLRELRSQLDPRCGVISVLKADAYGHGAPETADALKADSQAFALACLSEALILRKTIPDHTLLILAPCLPTERKEVVAQGFIPTVSSIEEAAEYGQYATDYPVPISIKIDTGMGRIGIWKDRAEADLRVIARLPGISVHSIATHLPSRDEDPAFSEQQLEWIENHSDTFRKLFPGVLLHALNSAGILEFPRYAFDLVRPGLALYGIASPKKHQHRLQPALSWKARVINIREVDAGRSISYGRTYITPQSTRLATLSVGYADGYPRQLSGTSAYILICGHRCPVVGRITMDQTIVDVSALSQIHCGDEAVLIGEQGSERIIASDVADWANTIANEILTNIHGRVKRIFLES